MIRKNTQIAKYRKRINRKHKCYCRSEQKINLAIIQLSAKENTKITVKLICETAGVAVSTFYRHYPNLRAHMDAQQEIFIENLREALGLDSAGSSLTKYQAKGGLKRLFLKLLLFIFKHKQYFELALACMQYAIFKLIFNVLIPIIKRRWARFGNMLQTGLSTMHAHHLISLIACWGQREGFNLDKAHLYAGEMARLSEGDEILKICQRLGYDQPQKA